MKRLSVLIAIVLLGVTSLWAQANDIESLYELGITTYWDYGTEADAVEIFTQVIALDPNFIAAYAYRGATYRLINQMELAKADFDYALQRDPQNGLALSMLARWHMQRGELTLALELSRQALALEPNVAVVHYNHARILTNTGSYQDGFSAYDEAIRLEKNAAARSQYYYNRGVELIEAYDDRLTAIESFTAALESDPTNPLPYASRAHNYILFSFVDGFLDLAVVDLEQALAIDPEFTYALGEYGNALMQLGRYDEALAALESGIALDPTNADFYVLQGLVYAHQEDATTALGLINQALVLDPQNDQLYFNRAIVHKERGDIRAALDDYTRAIQLNPNNHQALLNRGNLYTEDADYAAAIADYSAAIVVWPSFTLAYNVRGIAYSRQGNHEAALADFATVIELTPFWSAGHYNAGLEFYALGQYDEAIEAYTRSIELDPTDIKAYQSRAWAYRMIGALDKASADEERAIELGE